MSLDLDLATAAPVTFSTDPVAMAKRAAECVIAAPPEPSDVVPLATIYTWAGVQPPPNIAHRKDFEADAFWRATFMKALKDELLDSLGRVFDNVHGLGYRLMAPAENAAYAEGKVYATVTREMRRATSILQSTSLDALTPSQQSERNDAAARLVKVGHLVRRSRREMLTRQMAVAQAKTPPESVRQ